jgi:hypothetical protein
VKANAREVDIARAVEPHAEDGFLVDTQAIKAASAQMDIALDEEEV